MPDLARSTFILPDDATPTAAQIELSRRIQRFVQANRHAEPAAVFVIHGDAGSGKSVILNAAFTAIQHEARGARSLAGLTATLLVNHNEMLKVYQEVAARDPLLHKKDFAKPTPFINARRKAQRKMDVVFVDEAQLLLSQPDPFNAFRAQNQLDEIMTLAHVVVLVFDSAQSVKLKSYWDSNMLQAHLRGHEVESYTLHGQMRMQDEAVSAWINRLITGHLDALPQPSQKFDLRIFADGTPLYDWVKARDRQVGLARMIATTDFPFRVFGDKTWYVDAGSLHLPWDKINFTDRPWASRPETVNEVGSMYTIQGFDLNYAGVILGPSVDYDAKADRVVLDPALFEDQEAFRKRAGQAVQPATKRAIIFHTVNILLKRGRLGLGIYAVQPALRHRLLKLQAEQKQLKGG